VDEGKRFVVSCLGITDALIRVSVDIEDTEDLVKDLAQALEAVAV